MGRPQPPRPLQVPVQMSPRKTPPSHLELRTAAGPLPRRPPANILEAVAPSRSRHAGDPASPRPVQDLSPQLPGPTLRSHLQRHRENEVWRATRPMPALMPSLKAMRGRPGPELRGQPALGRRPLGRRPGCAGVGGGRGGQAARALTETVRRSSHPCPSMPATAHPPTAIGAIRACPSPDTVLWGSPLHGSPPCRG